MSDSVGEKPVSLRFRLIVASILVAAVAALAIGIGTAAHAAQVKAQAQKAMAAAAPAYQGAISLGGNLDQLAVQSVQAKAAYDAEQTRIAAEAAAKAAAELQRQQEAAAEAQRQVEAQEAVEADQQSTSSETPAASDDAPSSDPIRCPAGSQANSNDGVNDTSCFPVVCFTIQVPDPAHPECDVAFKP